MPDWAKDVQDKTRRLQIKLYLAAKRNRNRRFHALYQHIFRRDMLERAWYEVRRNRGAAGVDGVTIRDIEESGVDQFLDTLQAQLEAGTYRPQPVRQKAIPKPQGGERRLGIPALADRVVQAAAKLVLEPIFEADFHDCSFGFRPRRSAQQALERIRKGVNAGKRWVVDADIRSFFDEIDRGMLVELLRERISDRRVLRLNKGWLRAGVLAEGTLLHPEAGTPQGGVASPLMANVYLNRLDHIWAEQYRHLGELVRYADDLVILCPTKQNAEAALRALRSILAELKLELSEAKTRLVNLEDEGQGFDFLGFHHRWVESLRKKGRYFCARWPSSKAQRSARAKIKGLTDRSLLFLPVKEVIKGVNRFLVGWGNYFRHGNSTRTFHDLDRYARERVALFISKKHDHRGREYGLWVLSRNGYLGLHRLVGTVH